MINIKTLKDEKVIFILITFLTSFLGLIKSYFILKLFAGENLGLISLSQTFVMSIGLFHFGMITGGYRLFSFKNEKILTKVNSTVYVFFILLSFILFFLSLILSLLLNFNLPFYLVFFFTVIGIISLYSNWVICKLLAFKKIKDVNNSQLLGASVSLLLVVFFSKVDVFIVYLAFFVQPFLIIVYSYRKNIDLIPSFNFYFFNKLFKPVMRLGFIPYLTTALFVFNTQIGRWGIAFSLGTVMLGVTFLPSLFSMVGSIFSNALSNLYFPKIIEQYENKKYRVLVNNIQTYIKVLIIYTFFLVGATILLSDYLITLFLSEHKSYSYLVYFLLPIIVFHSLSNPAITLFNAAKMFDKILYGGLLLVISYLLLVFVFVNFMETNIEGFFVIESISLFLYFCYNLFYFNKLFKKIKNHEQELN